MIFVTGATGNVGRELVKLVLGSGEEVGAVTRDPGFAALPAGVRVVSGDPCLPKTLTSALRGVEAVLLSPRAIGHGAAELRALAGEHGARRVVLLSAVTVEHPAGRLASPTPSRRPRTWLKGVAWTGPTSSVHERDIAAVAASALASPAHAGHCYVLTGPQSLTQRDKVRLIGEAIGTEVSFQEISPQQVRRTMISQGLS